MEKKRRRDKWEEKTERDSDRVRQAQTNRHKYFKSDIYKNKEN